MQFYLIHRQTAVCFLNFKFPLMTNQCISTRKQCFGLTEIVYENNRTTFSTRFCTIISSDVTVLSNSRAFIMSASLQIMSMILANINFWRIRALSCFLFCFVLFFLIFIMTYQSHNNKNSPLTHPRH